MAVTLTQTDEAAFPDRGRCGLKATLGPGEDGAYVRHDLSATENLAHVRIMMRCNQVSGAMRVAGACASDGLPTWWLDLDADSQALSLEAPGTSVGAALNELLWHCIEVKADTVAGETSLQIDGRDAGTIAGSAAATASVWLGVTASEPTAAGVIYFDEWAISTEPIAPVVVPAKGPYANDPARWLVVYNAADADSVRWAEAYRVARGIPFANLLGLNLPSEETIDEATYAALNDAVHGYLNDTGLTQQIMGILCGYRVPGYVQFGVNLLHPVASLLAVDAHHRFEVSNPNFSETPLQQRLTYDAAAGQMMTARIDAPDLVGGLALIDRADELIDGGVDDGAAATIWVDPFAAYMPPSDPVAQRTVDWAQSVRRMQLRLPFVMLADETSVSDTFASIQNDGFLWSMDAEESVMPPLGFFGSPSGCRVLCAQLDVGVVTGGRVRSGSASNWVEAAIDAGYAAAAGSSQYVSSSTVPYVGALFDGIRRGWVLAEAWYAAMPYLRSSYELVGDPLLQVALPEAGWNVYGPMTAMRSFDATLPTVAIEDAQRSVVLSDEQKPGDGQVGFYVVRHVDASGRSEAGLSLTRVMQVDGAALGMSRLPVWPHEEGWSVRMQGGQVVCRAV